jgi:hypothetical protein
MWKYYDFQANWCFYQKIEDFSIKTELCDHILGSMAERTHTRPTVYRHAVLL